MFEAFLPNLSNTIEIYLLPLFSGERHTKSHLLPIMALYARKVFDTGKNISAKIAVP